MPYTPTHEIPAGGLPAWGVPDGTQPPVATLEAGLDVQLVEERGQWARVSASNGWEGWVDGSRLTPREASVADVPQVPEEEAAAVEPAIPESPIASPVIPEPPAVRDDTQLSPEVGREGTTTELPVFEATHAAPPDGLQTWTSPDPSQPAVATLAAGTELSVVEERGQWAHVQAANGWTGWVDATRLRSLAPPEPVTEFVAPPGGIQAWQEPDPSQPAVATLHGGTELHLVEQRGQWAQVEAANGWTVWVDATLLVPRG